MGVYIANFAKRVKNINRLQFNLSTYQCSGPFKNIAIYTLKKRNISIYTPRQKKFYDPLPPWALGRRTPGICLGPTLNMNHISCHMTFFLQQLKADRFCRRLFN